MITRINEFQAAAGKAHELRAFLSELSSHILTTEGCISCELLCHNDYADRFVVLERWESIHAHQAALQQFPKEQMQAAMVLLGTPPQGAYYQS